MLSNYLLNNEYSEKDRNMLISLLPSADEGMGEAGQNKLKEQRLTLYNGGPWKVPD